MRHRIQGTFRDGTGHVVSSATATVFLTGTTTPASIYAASTGGVAIHSVVSASDGTFYFYVDDLDYSITQAFDVALSKAGFVGGTFFEVPMVGGVASDWMPTTAPTYISGTTFTVVGDQITLFAQYRAVKATLVGSTVYSSVSSSSFGAGVTTVVLATSVLTNTLSAVFSGLLSAVNALPSNLGTIIINAATTAYTRTLLDDATAAEARTTLDTMATATARAEARAISMLMGL